MGSKKIRAIPVILAVLFIGLALFSGISALSYSAIIFACFAAVRFFAVVARPADLSEAEFDRLEKKFSGKVIVIDALSVLFVLLATLGIFAGLVLIKESLYREISQAAVFSSSPLGLLFIAAFLLSLSIVGWLIHFAVRKLLGSDYWQYYYNRKNVGFDTKKIFGFISLGCLVLSVPALVFGLSDFSAITENGVHRNSGGFASPVDFAWSDISEIWEFAEAENPFYVVSFSSGKKWNTSNENWTAPQGQVMAFVSAKSGQKIEKN